MVETRSGALASVQIGAIGAITNLSTANFKLANGDGFNIKNDGDEAVTLEVNLYKMGPGAFVETKFEPGWNPEIVREIKSKSGTFDLKYGY